MTMPSIHLYTDGTLLCRDAESIGQVALEALTIKQEQVRHLVANRPITIDGRDRFTILETIRAPSVGINDGASLPHLASVEANVGLNGHVRLARIQTIKGDLSVRSSGSEIPWLTMVDGSVWCSVGSRLPRLTTITGNYWPSAATNTPALIRVGGSFRRSDLQPRSKDEEMGASFEHLVGAEASRALGLADVARTALALAASECSSGLEDDSSEHARWGLSL